MDLQLYHSMSKRRMIRTRASRRGAAPTLPRIEKSEMNALFAQTGDQDHMNGWGGSWMWLWGVVMMALFVALIVWLVRTRTGSAGSGQRQTVESTERARGILAERLAKGELSSEEYRERLDALR